MLNHFDDRIKLLALTFEIVDSFPVEHRAATEVWADRKSVTRAEYYQASQSGIKADVIFTVPAIDYAGQSVVEYDGELYDVVRTYQTELDHIDLTCTKRGERT